MKWQEFAALLYGLGADTPLGRIVSIRSEEDKDVIKHFTKDQKRIRSEWRVRQGANCTIENANRFYEEMKMAFIKMAGNTEGR